MQLHVDARSAGFSHTLSVLLPVYNEEQELEACLQRVFASTLPCEIVAVDDCSNDATPRILAKQLDPRLRVIHHEQNCGKGGAIQTALEHARGELVIIQDADTEYDPRDYEKLMQAFEANAGIAAAQRTVVYGTRDLSTQPLFGYLGNVFLTVVTNLLCGTRLRDMETCYKLVPTSLMRELRLQSRGFEIEPEITTKLARRGAQFIQVPVSYSPRKEKKLRRLRDGIKSFRALLEYRFSA